MYYLKDLCALIFSGVTLYDGLSNYKGMVALYGIGDDAKSLFKYGSIRSMDDIALMLQRDTKVEIKLELFSKGPIYASVCVPKNVGVKGMENYLHSRGFIQNDKKFENQATDSYIRKSRKSMSNRKKKPYDRPQLDFIPELGREIAAGLAVGRLQLSKFRGVIFNQGDVTYTITDTSPIDMGRMTFITTMKRGDLQDGLIYINGKLRILRTIGNPSNSDEWFTIPRFDTTDYYNQKITVRLDLFFHSIYHRGSEFQMNDQRRVFVVFSKNLYKDMLPYRFKSR